MLQLRDNLLFTSIVCAYQNKMLTVNHVLIDTGSASTILAMDAVEEIGVMPEPDDTLHIIRGVGGSELVFVKQLDYLQLNHQKLFNFKVEIGEMDYGFNINGILGMDFLLESKAILDLNKLEIHFK
jgi:predicted aspartyl protease